MHSHLLVSRFLLFAGSFTHSVSQLLCVTVLQRTHIIYTVDTLETVEWSLYGSVRFTQKFFQIHLIFGLRAIFSFFFFCCCCWLVNHLHFSLFSALLLTCSFSCFQSLSDFFTYHIPLTVMLCLNRIHCETEKSVQ